MKRSNSYEDTFSIDTKRKTAEKTRLRHTYTLLLNMPLSIVWMKGFLNSFFKAKEPAVNALAYAQLMVRRCEYYYSKVNKKFGKSFRNVHIECAEYLVKYHAADDRIQRTVASIEGYDTKSISTRRRYIARKEREYLYNFRSNIRITVSADMAAIECLSRDSQNEKIRIGAKTKSIIYQYIRGLTRGKTDLSLLGEDRIDEMIEQINNPISIPDLTVYREIINEKEDNSNV